MNNYITELKKKNGVLIARIIISAPNRREAVHKIQLWYWEKYKGSLGFAHKVLTVSDPVREVAYDSAFNCAHKKNKLLTENVILRVIAESNGELKRETHEGARHHPPGSVRRIRRRRDFGVFIAPNIRRMKNGTVYYRVVLTPQVSKRGRVLARRQYRDIRLDAKALPEAIVEIRDRRLKAEHEKNTKRLVKSRSLKFTEHVTGLRELAQDDKKFFADLISRYESKNPAHPPAS